MSQNFIMPLDTYTQAQSLQKSSPNIGSPRRPRVVKDPPRAPSAPERHAYLLLSPLGMLNQLSSPSVPTVYCTVSAVHLLRLTLSFLALATRHIMSPTQMCKNREILFPIVGQLSAWNTGGALPL